MPSLAFNKLRLDDVRSIMKTKLWRFNRIIIEDADGNSLDVIRELQI